MYRNFHQGYRESIPSGLPARFADPSLMTDAKPVFARIGEGNDPRNELMRVVHQYPSQDEVRARVVNDVLKRDASNKWDIFTQPNNIGALRAASQELGIPLESAGLRIAANPFRLEGDVTDVDAARTLIGRAASNLAKAGKPYLYDILKKKAVFHNQPTGTRQLVVNGYEGIDSILEDVRKAEPRVTATSQGNRPILMQADGLDPNIGIPSGSPENIPPMDIEGLSGAKKWDEIVPKQRFISMDDTIYDRTGQVITPHEKYLVDTNQADLEDRNFILRDPDSVNQTPVRALASRLPSGYFFRGAKRDIPNEDRAKYSTQKVHGNYATGVTVVDDSKALTDEIGSIIGYKPTAEEYRDSKRLGFEVLGMGQKSKSILNIPEKVNYTLGNEVISKQLWGTEVEVPTGRQAINSYVEPSQSKEVTAVIPAKRMSDSMSDHIIANPNYLKRFEPFKSNTNTYGATQGKTPWREYYSDPFAYEDKTQDVEAKRLMNAVINAPSQLESALMDQASANRRASNLQDTINTVRRMGRGTTTPQSDTLNMSIGRDMVVKPTALFNSLKGDRRIAETRASVAQDKVAQLRAVQDMLGVEYMGKPELFDPDVLKGYEEASVNKGAIKNSGYSEGIPTVDTLEPWRRMAVKPLSELAQNMKYDNEYARLDTDHDIASLFGFSGNY